MGYNTDFSGRLNFPINMPGRMLKDIKKFLGEDCRDHPEWGSPKMTHINLQFTDDFMGLEWNGDEKSYHMTEKINLIVDNIRKTVPDFYLSGYLKAQGEEIDDRYSIIVNTSGATEVKLLPEAGTECPSCGHKFLTGED